MEQQLTQVQSVAWRRAGRLCRRRRCRLARNQLVCVRHLVLIEGGSLIAALELLARLLLLLLVHKVVLLANEVLVHVCARYLFADASPASPLTWVPSWRQEDQRQRTTRGKTREAKSALSSLRSLWLNLEPDSRRKIPSSFLPQRQLPSSQPSVSSQ